MQTAQPGDRVKVHYSMLLSDGCKGSSRGGAPLDVTVGKDHPRLPGLGTALVGMTPGASTTVSVTAERGFGKPDPSRVHRWTRDRFPKDHPLPIGQWVRVMNSKGQRRFVRILEVQGKTVVVDTNHRGAGQGLELRVELIAIQSAATGSLGRD